MACSASDFDDGVAMRSEAFSLRRKALTLPASKAKEMAILTAGEALSLLSIDAKLARRHLEACRKYSASASLVRK
jgi:hypothetical protein